MKKVAQELVRLAKEIIAEDNLEEYKKSLKIFDWYYDAKGIKQEQKIIKIFKKLTDDEKKSAYEFYKKVMPREMNEKSFSLFKKRGV